VKFTTHFLLVSLRTLGMYSGGIRFESRPDYILS